MSLVMVLIYYWVLFIFYFIYIFKSEVHINASICMLVVHWHGASTRDRVGHAIIVLVVKHRNDIEFFQRTLATYYPTQAVFICM